MYTEQEIKEAFAHFNQYDQDYNWDYTINESYLDAVMRKRKLSSTDIYNILLRVENEFEEADNCIEFLYLIKRAHELSDKHLAAVWVLSFKGTYCDMLLHHWHNLRLFYDKYSSRELNAMGRKVIDDINARRHNIKKRLELEKYSNAIKQHDKKYVWDDEDDDKVVEPSKGHYGDDGYWVDSSGNSYNPCANMVDLKDTRN